MFGRWLNPSPCWDPNGSLSALAHFVSVVFCFVGCVTNVDQETCIVFGRILTNFKTLKNGLRVAPFAKANGMKRKRAALADDGSGNPKKQLKGGDLPPESSTPGSNKNQFKGYDLLQVPKEAWPQQKENKGKHGYTLTAANGAVTCSHEVNMHAIYCSEPPNTVYGIVLQYTGLSTPNTVYRLILRIAPLFILQPPLARSCNGIWGDRMPPQEQGFCCQALCSGSSMQQGERPI